MKEKLDDYFLGIISQADKRDLLDKVEADGECKKEFIRMQNTVALSKICPQKGDDKYVARMMDEFAKKKVRKQVRFTLWKTAKYAAIIAVLLVNAWFLFYSSEEEEEVTYTTIQVPKGQRVCMTLQDGTEAWLSPRSTLRIPSKFNTNERVIELDGEGYFAVAADKEKPFIVQTGKHNVRVLGTRFNVFSYSESHRFETDLLEGKVEVFNRFNPQIVTELSPGERVYLKNDQLVKTKSLFDNEDYLKNGIFSFSNKPFAEILEYLRLWYDIQFDVRDSAKKELLVSGKFRQSDEIKYILKALQGVHSFKYKEISDQTIEIY